MPKAIFNIHSRIQLALKKGIGSYFPPDKVDAEIQAESLNLWKEYSLKYELNADITAIMDIFRRSESVVLDAGLDNQGTLIDAWQRPVSVSTGNEGGKKIEIVDIAQWFDRMNHPLKVPNENYPVCMFEDRTIKVLPDSIGGCIVRYLKYPTAPVYAFTTTGSRYIYNDSSSVDIEWPFIVHDDIINRVLSNLGLNNREPEVIQYAELQQKKEVK